MHLLVPDSGFSSAHQAAANEQHAGSRDTIPWKGGCAVSETGGAMKISRGWILFIFAFFLSLNSPERHAQS